MIPFFRLFRSRVGHCLSLLVVGLLLTSCSSPSASETKPAEYWDLGVKVGEPNAVLRLYPGAPMATVLELLGEPKRKAVKQVAPLIEEWFYERRVQFGVGMKSVVTQTAQGTVASGQLYTEKATIIFQNGNLHDITITRRREDVEIMSPFERSLRDS